MPGIRYAEVRAGVTIAEVLDLLGFVASAISRDQGRKAPCVRSPSCSASASPSSSACSNVAEPPTPSTPSRTGMARPRPGADDHAASPS